MADEKFIEQNKEVLIEEMADSITKLNKVIESVLQTPISDNLDGSLMRTYFVAASMQIGSLTTLFNQYYVLLKGAIPKSKRPAGFASLIKKADAALLVKPETQEPEVLEDGEAEAEEHD